MTLRFLGVLGRKYGGIGNLMEYPSTLLEPHRLEKFVEAEDAPGLRDVELDDDGPWITVRLVQVILD